MHLSQESPSRTRIAAARLYAITPDAGPEGLDDLVAAWLRGGVDVVQLRSKTPDRGRLLDAAKRLRAMCAAAGVPFIVNDHPDVAMLAGADGVHLGEDDLSVRAAREVAGPALIIGASAATPETAAAAVASSADYIGAGPAWATPIKAEKPAIGPAGVAAVQAAVEVPVFAIGGIDASRAAELRAAGVRRACVIRALSDVEDPEAAARVLKAALMA